MRRLALLSSLAIAGSAAPPALFAQQAAEGAGGTAGGGGLMSLQVNLMFWTLIIFIILFILLAKFAFPPIIGAVEKREQALQDAIDQARRDRETAAALIQEQRQLLERARDEAQQVIAQGRATGEKLRQDLLEQTHREQQEMLDRARQEIESEKVLAIAQLRREAVDLAIAGAGKIIEENLNDQKNRQLVERFLGSLGAVQVSR